MLQGEEGGKDREPQVTSMVEFVIVLSRFLCGALLYEQIEKKGVGASSELVILLIELWSALCALLI